LSLSSKLLKSSKAIYSMICQSSIIRHALVLLFALSSFAQQAASSDLSLPSLGNASSSMISIEQERKLGQAWLRQLRRQVKTFDNPIIESYLSQTIYNLAPHSEVIDKDFRFVVVDSQALNAFAVPGSVIGINTGLFLHSYSEQEFTSVLAHELAHISQRHYARRLEKQKVSVPLALTGFLASVVIAATAGSEAGIAALASTQALGVENALAFSRQNEEEADRLGIITLYESGYDPRAMPTMFERMYRQTRLQGYSMPEYLSTHPLSENRIADTRNRATQYPRNNYTDSIEYHVCKALIINYYADTPTSATQYFESLIEKGNGRQIDGATFGLAVSLIKTEPSRSIALLDQLLARYPLHISIELTKAQALYVAGDTLKATTLFNKLYERNPNNYPISIMSAEHFIKIDDNARAEKILTTLVKTKSERPLAWYLLAETQGKTGDIVGLHISRAEYFYLNDKLSSAIEQLEQAKEKNKNDPQRASVIKKRLEEFRELKTNAPL
jgi:beta-barrel assembly-enhancing protease